MDQFKDWLIYGILRIPSYNDTTAPVHPIILTAVQGGAGSLTGTYYYRVEVQDGVAGWGLFWLSEEKSVTVSAKVINLSWTSIPGAGTYNIYRGTAPGSYDTLIQTTLLSIVDTGGIGGAPGGPPNTLNYGTILNVTTAVPTFARLTGTTETFNLVGIQGGQDGRVVIVFHEPPTETGINMRIYNEHILIPESNRIWTLKSQGSVTSPFGKSIELAGRGVAGFIYNQAAAAGVGRWIHMFSYGSTGS